MRWFWVFLLLPLLLSAEDIYLKNGVVIKNVRIVEQNQEVIVIETDKGRRRIAADLVARIEPTPLQPGQKARVLPHTRRVHRPNLKLMPVSVVAFTLAYTYFDAASVAPAGKKARYYVQGGLVTIAGVTNLVIALKEVEIRPGPGGVSVNYQF